MFEQHPQEDKPFSTSDKWSKLSPPPTDNIVVSSWKWISLTVPLWNENSLSVELLIQLSASNPTTITDLSFDPVWTEHELGVATGT